MLKNPLIYFVYLTIPAFINDLIGQEIISSSLSKRFYLEYFKSDYQLKIKKFNIIATSAFTLNSNLPNLENNNGLYIPKGYGSFKSFFIGYYGKYLTVTAEPSSFFYEQHKNALPDKLNIFSKLNDAQRGIHDYPTNIRNIGFLFNFKKISIGYGNWNHWIGNGVHNSLIMSNNSEGFYNFIIKSKGLISKKHEIYYNIKYLLSNPITNAFNRQFYITTNEISINYKNFILGLYSQTLSGANDDIKWSRWDALSYNFNNKHNQYWDKMNVINLEYNGLKKDGLIFFFTAGLPRSNIMLKINDFYNENSLGTIIGLRKYGLFNNEKLHFGLEYLRLVQGIYYNILPTPNWYDNIRYDYHSYRNRRWSSHSGSDSDDFFIYFGYINNKLSLMYGINYERHGVTYKFPPEVKIESKISLSYLTKNNFEICLDYEEEYFEHYAFLDQNINVWQQTFENGSIQRTKTIFFEIKYIIKSE